MTGKYYYDDPIIAIYMATAFKVRLVTYTSDEEKEDYNMKRKKYYDWFRSIIDEDTPLEFYDMKDLLEYVDDISGRIYVHPKDKRIFDIRSGDALIDGKIFIRDNKQFFMPQIEAKIKTCF